MPHLLYSRRVKVWIHTLLSDSGSFRARRQIPERRSSVTAAAAAGFVRILLGLSGIRGSFRYRIKPLPHCHMISTPSQITVDCKSVHFKVCTSKRKPSQTALNILIAHTGPSYVWNENIPKLPQHVVTPLYPYLQTKYTVFLPGPTWISVDLLGMTLIFSVIPLSAMICTAHFAIGSNA